MVAAMLLRHGHFNAAVVMQGHSLSQCQLRQPLAGIDNKK